MKIPASLSSSSPVAMSLSIVAYVNIGVAVFLVALAFGGSLYHNRLRCKFVFKLSPPPIMNLIYAEVKSSATQSRNSKRSQDFEMSASKSPNDTLRKRSFKDPILNLHVR